MPGLKISGIARPFVGCSRLSRWLRRGVAVVVVSSLFFLLLSCKPGTQMNESSVKPRYDRLLFTFIFVFVSPAELCSLENFNDPWCAIVVDIQTFERKQAKLLTM
jgi:hypothetical protein